MDLSIVIPAFNEAAKIAADVEAAAHFLAEGPPAGEILVVDDGSTDGTAAAAQSAAPSPRAALRVIRSESNRGKGHAVRRAVAETHGQYVLFADAGLCVPFENAKRGLELLRRGECDIAHGSRRLPETTILRASRPRRRLVAWSFRRFLPLLVGLPNGLTDTQCGFKLYRGEVARELYAQCVCDGFLFDVEIILRAARAGYRIMEFPIEWRSDPDSRLHPFRGLPRFLAELWKIRRALSAEDDEAASQEPSHRR